MWNDRWLMWPSQVSIRLDFLQCLLKQSPVKLSVDDVDSLWDALIAGQVPQDQQSRALLWFIAACAAAENAKGPDDFCALLVVRPLRCDAMCVARRVRRRYVRRGCNFTHF